MIPFGCYNGKNSFLIFVAKRRLFQMVSLDFQNVLSFVDSPVQEYALAAEAHRQLYNGTSPYSGMTGWLQLPKKILAAELSSILDAAETIRSLGSTLLVVGIGGSYLGARAAIELLCSPSRRRRDVVRILYLGNTLSPSAICDVITELGSEDFCVNVVSKSGGTLEPALGFRIAKQLLEERYGADGARARIFVTTDANHGILHDTANAEGYRSFIIPDDVGGRYSVLSAVGLLPMAAAGIDIEMLLRSAKQAFEDYASVSDLNPSIRYAALRRSLLRNGKNVELLSCFEPSFHYFAEWWKQLFGESEGKGCNCIFPASLEYNADLHSMGQLVQDGPRNLLETTVRFDRCYTPFSVPPMFGSRDGFDHLAGFDFGEIQHRAADAVRAAHIDGGVPSFTIHVSGQDEQGLADLICFFEVSCAVSAMIGKVNPFDQPGVELYKKNMLSLLSDLGSSSPADL